jgi:transcriptional regulator with XRE-family HTH domain
MGARRLHSGVQCNQPFGGTTMGMDLRWLGRVIRERRGALNMTQPELADRAGVSLAYVSMLEAGGLPEPGLDALTLVARALGLARLVSLLEEVGELRSQDGGVPQSVLENAVADAVTQFLTEARAA